MDYNTILAAFNALPLNDRMRFLEDASSAVEAEQEESGELSQEEKDEIDRRLANYEANPESVVPWEVIREELLARLKK